MSFNEWAVPGLGGASFVRQLSWSCIGIALADQMGKPTMAAQVAEGVEALASWIALRRNKGYEKDRRVQGKRKFGSTVRLSFDDVRKRGAYVTVPFRRPASSSLAGLGFCRKAEQRFSALKLDSPGLELVDAALGKNGARSDLLKWFSCPEKDFSQVSAELSSALLPDYQSAQERQLVLRQLQGFGEFAERRRNVMELLQGQLNLSLSDFDASARAHFLYGIRSPEHRDRLDGSFALERVRLYALRCAQKIVDSFTGMARIAIADLVKMDGVARAFAELAESSRLMREKLRLLPEPPIDITQFCQEQDAQNALADRFRYLVMRVPLLFALNGEQLTCHGRDRGRLVDEAEPGEAEMNLVTGDVPRPLWRLKWLLLDTTTEILESP
ncbi:hypothetical protein MKD49_06115 [Herbaspirillum sp. WGmk3]|uniref:hypothetical protein n=1 Tax=Herbaspirillum sp. WGmk3 TaxID=2919925 RepID=UPI0020913803|nr:hypothetical protein [Herbaspirillum sp. WGmk3]MCO4856054.1 hypothetical protein [Herbaspirillum sp. WGmk3]